ncbi:uncharacterized protein LOC129942301 [Eupeodes corollae]|uniref:uncharacterized protein LOC129942301 n=1 Tax=Eupeodes corollae TaxID=290404 RepID=UPI0024916611|nr:uncharacterized protein LOC129942301 [Eupeodes corollae]
MAIDFLIFGFLVISFIINLLPLGAFWVTPGLRTTANRFVINLLIINLIGCCILAPTLYLSDDDESFHQIGSEQVALTTALRTQSQNTTTMVNAGGPGVAFHNKSEHSSDSQMTTFQCNSTYCSEQLTFIEERDEEKIVITELNEKKLSDMLRLLKSTTTTMRPGVRCWSIDLAAALGALSVLLVVGDTWMAVRDPLRYHSRISGLKSWVLIAMTWVLGVLFGVMSALREINFQYNTVFEKRRNTSLEQIQVSSFSHSTIFSMIFACIYFIVIILLPFGFVCGMYWRIFSEAKENGLRMRQNGSSPLLQSATNLTHSQEQQQRNAHLLMRRNSITNSTNNNSGGGGGLQLKIDRKRNHKDSIPTTTNTTTTSNTVKIAEAKKPKSILPPLSEPDETSLTEEGNTSATTTVNPLALCQSTKREIKRNYSVRQLPVAGLSSHQDTIECSRLNSFRQIKSSPNLQKRSSLTGLETTFHLRNHHHPHASPKSLSYMTSIRRRLSNASSLFKQREESRAARISILVVIMFLVSYLPYGLLVLLQDRLIDNFPHSTQLAVLMILLANFSSPFIFAYRNKRVRHGVTRLFGLDARSKDHRLQCKGIFLRYGTKARISVKRSSSKVSAYSMNSCKYLTPILKHTNRSLRNKIEENKHEANTFLTSAQVENSLQNSSPPSPQQSQNSLNPKCENINDAVDTTITIQLDAAHHSEKFSMFKVFCKRSKSVPNCAATNSCIAESIEV